MGVKKKKASSTADPKIIGAGERAAIADLGAPPGSYVNTHHSVLEHPIEIPHPQERAELLHWG